MRRRDPVVNIVLMLAMLLAPAFHLQGQKGGYRPAPVYRPPPPPPPPPRRPPPPPANNNNRTYNNRTPANNNNRSTYNNRPGGSSYNSGAKTQASTQRLQQRRQQQQSQSASRLQQRQQQAKLQQTPQTRTLQRKAGDPVNGKRYTVISQGRRVNYVVPPMPQAQRNAARAKLAMARGKLASRLAQRAQSSAAGGGQRPPIDGGPANDNQQALIHEGKQGKHIPGHNNYEEGKSVLTADPKELSKYAGSGQPVDNKIPRGAPGFRERVDFKRTIGNYVTPSGESKPTTKGIIHYAKDGIHIVPAAPD